MNGIVKCFDAVSMVVEEATSQFAPIWKINNERYRILKQYCSAIDSIASEFEGKSFGVDIDDVKKTIKIDVECSDMTVDTKSHKYFSLAQRALSIGFRASDSGNLIVEFVFPTVWDRAV